MAFPVIGLLKPHPFSYTQRLPQSPKQVGGAPQLVVSIVCTLHLCKATVRQHWRPLSIFRTLRIYLNILVERRTSCTVTKLHSFLLVPCYFHFHFARLKRNKCISYIVYIYKHDSFLKQDKLYIFNKPKFVLLSDAIVLLILKVQSIRSTIDFLKYNLYALNCILSYKYMNIYLFYLYISLFHW